MNGANPSTDQPRNAPTLPALAEPSSSPLWRWGGYVLLLLSLFDLIEALIPIRLMDPSWELPFMGAFIERSPVLLMGFLLVFLGSAPRRSRRESRVSAILSWTALGIGVLELLMIPLLLSDTFRLETINAARLGSQVDQQLSQAQRLEGTVNAAPDSELESLVRQLGRTPGDKPPQELRAELLGDVAKAKRKLQSQADEAMASNRLALFKRSVKWALQALCVGALLVYIWRVTAWARRPKE
jgi:hypothetical protein